MFRTVLGVGLVVDHASIASCGDHHTITLVVWAAKGLEVSWAVDWDMVMVCSKTPSMSIWIVDKSTLEHLAV